MCICVLSSIAHGCKLLLVLLFDRDGKEHICQISGCLNTMCLRLCDHKDPTSGKVAATGVTTCSNLLHITVIHHDPSGFCRGQNGALNGM